jgi:hypothetical protein
MINPGDKVIRVEHVIEALEDMNVVIKRLLILFRGMDWDKELAVSVGASPMTAQPQRYNVPVTSGSTPASVAPPSSGGADLARIEPLPVLKSNCT